MNTLEFKKLIKNADYKTKYEPIINCEDNSIYGYEALSKFEINENLISTEEIFRKLHHNNRFFFELEKRNKILQIKSFSEDKKLFLNFDADIVHSKEQREFWDSFFAKLKNNVVVEITENGSDDEKSSKIMHGFSSWLSERGIESALDDFGQDGSMFSFFLMDRSKYIKIDKLFLHQIRENENYLPYLEGLVKTCKLNKQRTVLEGVETKADYYLAKRLKVDFMQGYYFNDSVIIR